MAKFTAEQVSFLHSMKGAPASIIIALALTGVSLTNEDLQLVTGYSDKPISKGLALLELHGLAQHNGRRYGWSLPQGIQLPLFPSALLGKGHDRSAPLGSGNEGLLKDRNISEDRNISDLSSENFRSPVTRARSSSSSLIPHQSKEKEEERKKRKDRKFSELRAAGDNKAVFEWLLRAGVGKRSKKMRELLELELSEEHVAAFVLDREAAIASAQSKARGGVDPQTVYPTGHLIRKLLDGDPVPPMRCEDCLQVLPCYCGVIQR